MKISIKFDPNKKYLDVEPQRLAMACGVLTHWAIAPEFLDTPILEAFEAQYRFPMPPMQGCTLTEEGNFTYPQDPVQYPLCRIKRLDETIYIYRNSVVCVVDKWSEPTFVRMD